jgi:AraC-like DNA-binding protein
MNKRLHQIQDWPGLAQQAKWSANTLAEMCGVSERTLRRFFLKWKGNNLKRWLAEQRQMQAVRLLNKGCSIKEAAFHLAYKQPNNFSRQYKNQTGICPSIQPNISNLVNQKMSANDRQL